MASGSSMIKSASREATLSIPNSIAAIADRMSRDLEWTFERSLLALLERGAADLKRATDEMAQRHEVFMKTPAGARKDEAFDDLLRSVFGPESVAQG